jgi:VWFA-related protein
MRSKNLRYSARNMCPFMDLHILTQEASISMNPLLLAMSLWIAAPAQDPTIKVEVPTVTVDVIVTDRKGHHVPGLTKKQFSILEDNVPQEIVTFVPGRSRIAGRAAEAIERQADERTGPPASPNDAARDQPKTQSITLLIDLGDLQSPNLKTACDAAAKYVDRTVSAGNLVSIYWVDYGLHLAVPFTSDKQRLIGAIVKLSERVPTGRLTARDRVRAEERIDDLFVDINPQMLRAPSAMPRSMNPMTDPRAWEMDTLRTWLVIANTFQARAVFMALRALALAYRDVPGRKSVVVFSEGFLHADEAAPEMQAVIDAANRSGVTFYVIDAVGANSRMTAEARSPDIGGNRSAPNPDFDGFGTTLGRDVFDWLNTLTSDVHGDLGAVARATGGFLVSDTNDFAAALERVELDGSEFYTLVYHPTNRSYDGAFRKIKVALDVSGYRLRFRQGYWAIPPGREVMMTPGGAQLLHAIETGSSKPSFAPDLRAAFVQARDGRFAVPVSLSMAGAAVPFEKKKDRYAASVTMLLVARNKERQVISLYERYGNLRFDRKEWKAFRQTVFNVNGHMPVPDLEQITVQGIVQFSTGEIGMTSQVPLEAGTPEADPRLTTLLLSSRLEKADCGADLTDPLCVKNMRIYFPARPSFVVSDRLVVYFTALGLAEDARTHQPAMKVSFELRSGETMLPVAPERVESLPGNAPHSLNVLGMFSLNTLTPGRYTLQANVEDTLRRKKSAERVQFVVVAAEDDRSGRR